MLELPLPLLQGVPGGPELIVLFMFAIVVGGFLLWLGLAYWVYRDASKRGNDDALLWAVVTFFLGLIGLVIYLVVRE